ncbi:hypothetical protein PR048_013886 [Dryococelus australis]|uniref:Uncharacterized protein n=1 Tax=Dryococelus australis TaxID=614101 RepID=A0ABQ9HTF7_9NEOP|nr:hypothetical protein PR048_013886 [Dryococelus australis]
MLGRKVRTTITRFILFYRAAFKNVHKEILKNDQKDWDNNSHRRDWEKESESHIKKHMDMSFEQRPFSIPGHAMIITEVRIILAAETIRPLLRGILTLALGIVTDYYPTQKIRVRARMERTGSDKKASYNIENNH